jgi:hypothetical protein
MDTGICFNFFVIGGTLMSTRKDSPLKALQGKA